MDSYWLSRAAQVEAELDQLRSEYAEAIRKFQSKIEELERKLLEANCNAQTTGVTSEYLQ
jgi:Skp family chaperone for outer membrane proteins